MSDPVQKYASSAWLGLTAAAALLNVHFSTLRRWADSGVVPCVRTPGGQRRFFRPDLERFLQQPRSSSSSSELRPPSEEDARLILNQDIRQHASQSHQDWIGQLNEAQRMRFQHSGRLMLGLLMQYNSRPVGGEMYLQEARSVMRDYGLTFRQNGFNLLQTVSAFLFFRHSIMDMILNTSDLKTAPDSDGWRLYRRTTEFLDALLLAVIEGHSATV